MRAWRSPLAQVALAAVAVLTVAGCSDAATRQVSQPSTSPAGSRPGTTSPEPPSPLAIEARYSATSLGLNQPANLAIAPDGDVYVTDASQRVTVLSPGGTVIRRWGKRGHGPGQFMFRTVQAGVPGVAATITVGADGRVYVGDNGNSRVQVFSPTGEFVRTFGSFGTGKNQFLSTDGLVVDGAGNVYVVDDQKETLSKISPSGAVEWQIRGTSAKDPDLIGHFHLSSSGIDSHGRILLTNDDQNRVFYIDSLGHKVDAFGSSQRFRDGACDVTVDAAGYTFVDSCLEPLLSPHYTEVFDRTHQLVGTWYPSPLGWAPRFGPHGEIFALGEDGSVLRLRLNLAER
jgi:hypothetical protein